MITVRQRLVRPLRLPLYRAAAAALLLAALPDPASAQGEKRWGVVVSFAPTWTANENLQTRLLWAPEDFPAHVGSELAVGVARANVRGGGWSISFVRKRLEDRSVTVTDSGTDCFNPPANTQCFSFNSTSTTTLQDVLADGVEVDFFIPFVRIRDRVAIGVNVGGGIGFSSGTVTEEGSFTSTFTNPPFPPQTETETFSDTYPASDEVIGRFVLFVKAEIKASVRLVGGLRVFGAAGLNAPSTFAARVGVVYLFGAR
jgi:hypothetical protein